MTKKTDRKMGGQSKDLLCFALLATCQDGSGGACPAGVMEGCKSQVAYWAESNLSFPGGSGVGNIEEIQAHFKTIHSYLRPLIFPSLSQP